MNITVYCGARSGSRPEYAEAAAELGKWFAENNHTLVFGGGRYGMMGIIADSVIRNGGNAVGVTPGMFIESEEIYDRLTELEVVASLSARRDRMLEMGDAFIAMPGGIGTLDEITEAIALAKLGINDKSCIFFNVAGYYDLTRQIIDRMVEEDFLDEETAASIVFAGSIEEINEAINQKLQAI